MSDREMYKISIDCIDTFKKIKNKKIESQVKKIQYHELMSKKHKGKVKFHYSNLKKIVRSDRNAKKLLKKIGKENEIFSQKTGD